MSDAAGDRDLGPGVPLECRAFLRAALASGGSRAADAHDRVCEACARRVARHRRLASVLATRPTPPAALTAPNLLSAIHERVIDASEAGPLGDIVRSLPDGKVGGAAAAVGWPEELLDSALAREVVSSPARQSSAVWARVRRTILADVRATPARRWRTRLWLGVGGVAATLIASALLLREGPSTPTAIVFTDFDVMPVGVDFVVLRYGER